jgi:hypothetical protein
VTHGEAELLLGACEKCVCAFRFRPACSAHRLMTNYQQTCYKHGVVLRKGRAATETCGAFVFVLYTWLLIGVEAMPTFDHSSVPPQTSTTRAHSFRAQGPEAATVRGQEKACPSSCRVLLCCTLCRKPSDCVALHAGTEGEANNMIHYLCSTADPTDPPTRTHPSTSPATGKLLLPWHEDYCILPRI